MTHDDFPNLALEGPGSFTLFDMLTGIQLEENDITLDSFHDGMTQEERPADDTSQRKTIKFARQFSSSSPLAVQVNTSYAVSAAACGRRSVSPRPLEMACSMTSARGMGILSHVACVYIATAASTRVASAQAIHQPGAFARHRASSSPSLCASGLGFPRPLPRRCSTTTTRAVRRSAKGEGHVYEVHSVAGDGRCLFRPSRSGWRFGERRRDDVGPRRRGRTR